MLTEIFAICPTSEKHNRFAFPVVITKGRAAGDRSGQVECPEDVVPTDWFAKSPIESDWRCKQCDHLAIVGGSNFPGWGRVGRIDDAKIIRDFARVRLGSGMELEVHNHPPFHIVEKLASCLRKSKGPFYLWFSKTHEAYTIGESKTSPPQNTPAQ